MTRDPWRRVTQFVWQLTVAVTKHDIASLASVIAFYAFFSLFPLLMLIMYAGSLLLPNSNIEILLVRLVNPYFPALKDAKEFISQNISRLSIAGAKVGLVSGVTLLWSATSGFIAVQQAMDVILEIVHQRSFLVRRLISFAMLVVLLLAMLGSAIVMTAYSTIDPSTFAHAGLLHIVNYLHGISRVLFPLSLFLGCLVFYRFLPSRPMPWVYLIPGALVATIALDTARQMFVWYGTHLVTYQILYGGLAAVMLLVLWMYIASIVMLFGAEVSAALQTVVESQAPPKNM